MDGGEGRGTWWWEERKVRARVAERVNDRQRNKRRPCHHRAQQRTARPFFSPPSSSPPPSAPRPPRSRSVADGTRLLYRARRYVMSHIGSVFLGDVQRHRHLSTSTPPSSPPPNATVGPGATYSFSDVDLDDTDQAKPPGTQPAPPSISPALSLELRLRWLETLLFGAKHDLQEQSGKGGAKAEKLRDGETLTRRAEELQRRLDGVAQSNDALKRFMDRCECANSNWSCAPHCPCSNTFEGMNDAPS